jgi:hypothetical protein
MPSPFPGMNPYLEQPEVWLDFHESFMPRARDALNAQVGEGYVVKIEERIYVHGSSSEERRALGRADVAISELPHTRAATAGVGILEAPLLVQPLVEPDELRQSYLEIRDRAHRSLVTVIELLSPSNKTGADREQYLAKRNELLRGSAHFVEIDLLRGGERMPFADLPPCDYYAMVRRHGQSAAGLWPVSLHDSLPVIPVPLKAPDADIRLDLQALLHAIYDAAGYAKYVYDSPPVPPLDNADAEWAASLIGRA